MMLFQMNLFRPQGTLFCELTVHVSKLTPEAFLAIFSNARNVLEQKWHVTVLDERIESSLSKGEIDATRRLLNEHSEQVRHVSKGERSLEHDAHMYYLVIAERARYGDKAAWILTPDTSLPQAAVVLQGADAVPFAMSLDGFLQIMSPYVRSDHQQSFAEMYVELIGRNLFPIEEVLQLEDFLLFTDMELTIHSLPGEDVKKIIRQVKKNLDGKSILTADKKRVAYEVQKALMDPTLKYRVSLEQEIALRDLQLEQAEEDRKRDQAKQQLELERAKKEFGTELAESKAAARASDERSQSLDGKLQIELVRSRCLMHVLRVVISGVILGVIAVIVWVLPLTWIAFAKTPIAFQLGICVAAVSTWVALSFKARVLNVLLFIIAVLGVLFTAWSIFW